MNCSAYLFGGLGTGYTQYPDDYTKNIFLNVVQNATAPSQIFIHREEDLMYYGYVRRLDSSAQYIGFCILLNGLMLTDITRLFSSFESLIDNLVVRGKILQFDENGKIVSKVGSLLHEREETDLAIERLCFEFSKLDKISHKLPPLNYSIPAGSIKQHICSDNQSQIVNSSHTYPYTLIYKSKAYNYESINSYSQIISRKQKKIREIEQKNEELKLDILKQKAKHRNFAWLAVLGFICLILFVVVFNNVINPSEVTKYPTKDFVYYGPIVNQRPHGTGVAIYYEGDKDGRVYYYGNFYHGSRKGKNTSLLYKDGSYFHGEMDGDHWKEGIFFDFEQKQIFNGTFDENNSPYTGHWYEIREVQELFQGRIGNQ